MSTTTNTRATLGTVARAQQHEIGARIGWALVELGDRLHDVAFRLSGGETPTRDVPSADALQRLGLTDGEATR